MGADLPAELQAAYERTKRELLQVGFICQGSLTTRHEPCRRPTCRCHADPPQLHGPYHLLTRKVQGKTVTLRLPPQQAAIYQQYISNRQRLQAVLDRMHDLSQQALEADLSEHS